MSPVKGRRFLLLFPRFTNYLYKFRHGNKSGDTLSSFYVCPKLRRTFISCKLAEFNLSVRSVITYLYNYSVGTLLVSNFKCNYKRD